MEENMVDDVEIIGEIEKGFCLPISVNFNNNNSNTKIDCERHHQKK